MGQSLMPVLPFLKNFVRCLHGLPDRFVFIGDLYRVDMGAYISWDSKVTEAEVLKFVTPLSSAKDPRAVRDFFPPKGDHTFTVMRDGVGYLLQELSECPREAEVVTELVTRMRITRAEKFPSDHELVLTGRVKEGLHRVEGVQIEGVPVLSTSPARRRELRLAACRDGGVDPSRTMEAGMDQTDAGMRGTEVTASGMLSLCHGCSA